MRADVIEDEISVFDNQDSSLLTVLSSANALLVRPPNDPARQAGETLGYLPI
jgi:molybdopterin molybdotransferase